MRFAWTMVGTLAVVLSACGGSGSHCEEPAGDAAAYLGFVLGKAWDYDVSVGAATLSGTVRIAQSADPEYVTGIDALKMEIRQNGILIATRWFQVDPERGLLFLGEQVIENSQQVDRRYLSPILLVPFPLEPKCSATPQSWSTASDIEGGGSENHLFSNLGKAAHTVPAGEIDAFHLVHRREIAGGPTFSYDEYFAPQRGWIEFELPDGNAWKLR